MSAITRAMEEALVGVQIERTGPRWGAVDERWAIGRLGAGHGEGRRVLVPIDGHGLVATCDPAVSVDVPAELAVETALLVPLVVETLRACDTLGAEIGTAVAISVAMPWSPILSAAARWYGAVPIQIGGGVDGEAEIDLSDADAVPRFTKKLAGYSAVAAVELSGRADTIDLLLEAVPPFARVLLAGPPGDRLTIDYYVNVHRKGMVLVSTVLSPMRVFGIDSDRRLVRRACQLLSNPSRARTFQAAVERGTGTAARA